MESDSEETKEEVNESQPRKKKGLCKRLSDDSCCRLV